MKGFYWIILAFFSSVQLLAFCLWRRRLAGRPKLRLALIFLFIWGNLPWLYPPFTLGQTFLPPDWVTAWVIRPFFTWQIGVLLWLVLAGSLALVIMITFRAPRWLTSWRHRRHGRSGPDRPALPDRRAFLVRTARAAVWGGALAATGWGLIRAGARPRVVSFDLSFDDLPRAADGLKIAHLTDLHIGRTITAGEVGRALDLTRQLEPDLVVITGDIIDQSPALAKVLTDHLDLLAGARLGIYGVIGNHDVYTGADAVTAALRAGGINMLRNQHHSLAAEGLPLALVGVDDPGRHWTGSGGPLDLNQAAAGLSPDLFHILLVHRPTGFDQARTWGIPLTLCGHTHGGQFAIPGGPNLADLAYAYTHGLYREPEGLVHVSAGLGTVGLPFRIGVDPEIALLRLSRKTHVNPRL